MARPDYCSVGNEPCQSMCDEPCSWQGSTRKDDTVLIRQLVEALETCGDDDGYNGPSQHYETVPVEEAVAAGRSRLLDSDLSKLTDRGAKAWTGIDAQDLRDGGKP